MRNPTAVSRPRRVLGLLALSGLAASLALGCRDSASAPISPPPASYRVERLNCALRDLPIDDQQDAQQRAQFMISAALPIAHSADSKIRSRWERGNGLSLRTRDAAGSVVFAAPLSLGEKGSESLLLRTSAPTQFPVTIQWTDDRCSDFSSACQATWPVSPADDAESRLDFSQRKSGALRELRFSLPPTRSLVIHSARSAPGPTSSLQTLLGVGHSPVPVAAHDAQVEWTAGGGLRITIPRDAGDPHFSWQTDLVAVDGARLVAETPGEAAGSIDVFFESSLCGSRAQGGFSPACRLRVDEPRDSDGWEAATGQHPRWRGRISRLRLDFNGMNGRSFELTAVRTDGRGTPAGWARDGLGAPPLLRRFASGGPLGWELAAGQVLDCTIPDPGESPPQLPDAFEFNVPADSAPLEILELRAAWVDAGGLRETAGQRQERASRPADSGWRRLLLDAPARWPAALSLELTCARNCSALNEEGRTIQVARPMVRWPADGRPTNLILIVIDTLRADHLSLYGYDEPTDPFLHRWSEQATVYDRVIAVGTRTIPTHAALFTGDYPLQSGRHHFGGLQNGTPTLAGRLGREGYATFAQTDGPLVSPEYGFDLGFDRFEAVYEPARNKFERFVEEASRHAESGEPYFGFLHTYAVHEPYSVSPEERAASDLTEGEDSRLPVPSTPLPSVSQRIRTSPLRAQAGAYLGGEYDRGIAAVDAELERLFEALSERGLLANTLVAITADHGEELLEHGRLGHGIQFPYREIAWVPLIVKEVGQRKGAHVSRAFSQAEIPNLLLSRLGVENSFESECLVPGHPAAFVSTRHYTDYPIASYFPVTVYLEDCQYLEISERSTESIVESAFLGKDPESCRREKDRLLAVVSCMKDRQRKAGHYGASLTNESAVDKTPKVDDATRRQLEALGYAE